MKIKCNKCGNTLRKPGGLLFSPPIDQTVYKFHICFECYKKLFNWLIERKNNIPQSNCCNADTFEKSRTKKASLSRLYYCKKCRSRCFIH